MKKTIIFLSLVIFYFFAGNSYAQPVKSNFGLSPAVFELEISPGEEISKEIIVSNYKDEPLGLKMFPANFNAEDYTGNMVFSDVDTESFSGMEWVELEKDTILLEPQGRQKVNFRIDVPENAEPGGHYVSLFFEPVSGFESPERSELGITQRMGAILLITVDGAVIEAGQVLGATTEKDCDGLNCSFEVPSFSEYGPVPFKFDFENNGNVHVKVGGKIEIFNIFKNKIAEIPIEEKTVLPGKIRTFEQKWMRELLLGRYRARLTLEYGSANNKEVAYATFWGFPYKIAGAVIGFFVVIFGSFYIRKLLQKKREKSS